MDRFYKFHPAIQLFYFVVLFIIIMSVSDPLFSVVSLICSVLYLLRLKGREMINTFKLCFVLILLSAFFNMMFSHYGEDALFTIGDTRFTLEALFYGFNQGLVISSAVIWFIAFGVILDSEKIIYVLSFAPKTALIFSMVLGFIPRFMKKQNDINDAQTALCGGEKPKSRKYKIKRAFDNLSVLITYGLDSSIITCNSMLARGYNPKAVKRSRFKINISDIVAFAVIALIFSIFIVEKIRGNISFVFDPQIYYENFSVIGFVSFIILALFPVAVDLNEDFLWKLSNLKT